MLFLCDVQATGVRAAMMIMSVSSILTGLVIGFVYSWQLTLLILGFAPFLIGAGYMEVRMISGGSNESKEAFEAAGKVRIWRPFTNKGCICPFVKWLTHPFICLKLELNKVVIRIFIYLHFREILIWNGKKLLCWTLGPNRLLYDVTIGAHTGLIYVTKIH